MKKMTNMDEDKKTAATGKVKDACWNKDARGNKGQNWLVESIRCQSEGVADQRTLSSVAQNGQGTRE